MRDLRNRMRSVGQSLQVTQAMKLISTAKLRKARRKLEEATPYFDAIREAMAGFVAGAEGKGGPWFDAREGKAGRRRATLVITSDRGLAGGYNQAVIRYVERTRAPGSILLPVGNVGKRWFVERDYVILEDFARAEKEPSISEAKEIAAFAAGLFLAGRIDEFGVVYTHMHSTVKLEPVEIGLLPLDADRLLRAHGLGAVRSGAGARPSGPGAAPRVEPDEEGLFAVLVPAYLKGVVYGALVESYASEQAARMAAMDSASKSARDMIDRLGLRYNRARQASITAELSEIVAGAAALEG